MSGNKIRRLRRVPAIFAFLLLWSGNAIGDELVCWTDPSTGSTECMLVPDDFDGDYAPNPGECVGPTCPDDPDPPNDGDDGWG